MLLRIYRLGFATLTLSAIITEIVTLLQRGTFRADNFFSFFTIESNIFAAIVLLLGAFASRNFIHSNRFTWFRGAATLYMVVTGIVFSTLLSNLPQELLTAVPWDNTVLHYIMPVVMLLDWAIDPPHQKLAIRTTLLWLLCPLTYVGYSLIRGAYVGWYPYPFLNPVNGGYISVAATSVSIAIVVTGVSLLLRRMTLKRPLK